jgi:G3E family GTPase
MALIPSTILTGFLGAGKTTLLNRILQENHGLKIAVIENEFGQENIDNEILLQDGNEQIVEMNNGCICCTVRGDLIVALTSLAAQRESGAISFDRIVIETTGLANPGPVAQTFFVDEEVGAHYVLDAVITVVDAHHAMAQLDDHEEAQRQVGFADRLLLSKTDLCTPAQVAALTARLKRINPRAPIAAANFGSVPIDEILDIHGFNLNDKLELDPAFLTADEAHDHAHHHAHDDDGEHEHTETCDHSNDHDDHGHDHDHDHHSARHSDIGAKWGEDEVRGSKMVFIGKNLPKDVFIRGLEQCLV